MSEPLRFEGLCGKLSSCKAIEDAARPGLKALAGRHRRLVDSPKVYRCSVDLDEARRADEPNASRWDYVLVASSAAIAMEVHPAKASEVHALIRKKGWAIALLGQCGVPVARWHWVRPPGSPLQFLRNSRQARLLAKAGISFPSSRLESVRTRP